MLKPEKMNASYSIEVNKSLYEEIRINEIWNKEGRAHYSDRYEEGYMWSELYCQSNAEPFDKWAYNFQMSFQDGTGTPESFFERHFSEEIVRRKALIWLYPDYAGMAAGQEDWKQDPRISWLYYKRSFDAVFPVLCEMGKTRLELKLEARLDDGKALELVYSTGTGGSVFLDGRHIVDVYFYDEKYKTQSASVQLEVGEPENVDGKNVSEIYGMHSLSELLKGLEMVAGKAKPICH